MQNAIKELNLDFWGEIQDYTNLRVIFKALRLDEITKGGNIERKEREIYINIYSIINIILQDSIEISISI